ncbi:enoyl-CoA hydratase/isomerase family protein [Tothia fuscella]|uniref:Enoyl-CoA hydratase/isomerase family protein n=1 Tax=Tothia fuscella TaxID=1048955 RepID=A0A9P4TST0_9PEZI|nr:enoyl-CoA hydratase/isomerase family protein [Tothia fuscella]
MPSSDYNYEYFNVTFPIENVAHVEINRAEKMNAFVEVMWLNLSKIFTRLSTDSNVRAILLTGAGPKAFTAGLDVQAASQGPTLGSGSQTKDPARMAAAIRLHAMEFQDCITAIEKCAKPVIVLLHGYSYGLGIDISVASDIRICTKDARMCVKEVDIGIAADIGTLTRLPKSGVSLSWVKDVALTAREFYHEEALRVGFVSDVYENKEAGVKGGLELAAKIAEKSPVAIFGTKELINWSRDRSVEDGLKYTAIWNGAMVQTADVKSALLSSLQRKTPKFEKL